MSYWKKETKKKELIKWELIWRAGYLRNWKVVLLCISVYPLSHKRIGHLCLLPYKSWRRILSPCTTLDSVIWLNWQMECEQRWCIHCVRGEDLEALKVSSWSSVLQSSAKGRVCPRKKLTPWSGSQSEKTHVADMNSKYNLEQSHSLQCIEADI